jgi:hypothetical protein
LVYTASLPFDGPLKRRPPFFPSSRLRPLVAVFRQLFIGGSRRDLSVEILPIKPFSRLTKAGMNVSASQSCGKSVPQAGAPRRWTRIADLVVRRCFMGLIGFMKLLPALSFRRLAKNPDDLAAVRVCPPAATKLFPRN